MNVDISSRSEQRKFGLLMAGAFTVIGGLRWGLHAWRQGGAAEPPLILWVVAAAFLVMALAWPRGLRPVFAAWMRFAYAMNWLVTHLVLTLAFVLMIVPLAMLFRLLARDPLNRLWNRSASSYWEDPERQPDDFDSYLNQF